MLAIREHRVCTLAHRIGLRLVRASDDTEQPLYRLVEPHSMTPVLPGDRAGGADLAELEDWLQFPWE
ncbi:MAG: hypothetical protein LJE69_03155 [Thiohalocapsa sp.]|jgi:hypothetical protein|uniref:hypothetical protein n=1 Tax=Thiohalocapsa sp. TaxID=2497641 RepID=UPI0025D79DBF|nr:hypothetical protein [Thiohalocapsa sp.]MCG6940232.1 hypothetical protein [Thiohalocapsa sp.]